MNTMIIQSQLLATKFYVPVTFSPLIARPRLTALLNMSLNCPLTLLSAPAGFGKTTLLSTWTQSLPANDPLVAWVSLDEEDNDPHLFWTYVLSALDQQQPDLFTALSKSLQSGSLPLHHVLGALCNLAHHSHEHLLLILDDYHLITEPQVHNTLFYLIERLPPRLHLILATRTDPPMSLSRLRTHRQILEVRTEQLRCTTEETRVFFDEIIGSQFPDQTIQQVTARTEGWLVGLQLLSLSLPQRADPLTLLTEVSGDQRYILDYLTEEVLRRQPQEIQTFLLFTCILQQLTASLCDAVLEQTGSQQMLEQLERANLFVVSLDSKRQWYRYHALFAEALRYQLERTHADLVPSLHSRASRWYAQHHQTSEAILHAFSAREWAWAADLIEGIPLMTLTSWGSSERGLSMLQEWLERLPADIVGSRPRLCFACTQVLWAVAPPSRLDAWFDTAERGLMASLTAQTHEDTLSTPLTPQTQQEQENLLGEVLTHRAFLRSYQEDGHNALPLCQQALAKLRADNFVFRAMVAHAQSWASYHSSANDAVAAIEYGLQTRSLAQNGGQTTLALGAMGSTALHMLGTGQLHQAQQLTKQARQLGTMSERSVVPDVGFPAAFQAAILCEWNRLDAAIALAEEAIAFIQQTSSITSLAYLLHGYAVLLHILLSRRDYDTAHFTLRQVEHLSLQMNQPTALFHRSFFAIVDQVRLWLTCGELDRAIRWAEELDLGERHTNPFTRERQEVARVRVFLARKLPHLALQRLEPVLQRASQGQRWGHVIEIHLLQTLAYQLLGEATQALDALSQAVRLAEPEGYIRSFVDEGPVIAALLAELRVQSGSTAYLDQLLASFPQGKNTRTRKRRQ